MPDAYGRYHLISQGRSACLGSYTASPSCERWVRDPLPMPHYVDLSAVPVEVRCERAATRWPPFIGPGGGRPASLRLVLVESLGPLCSICKVDWGRHIDHEHTTGLVRGWLCGSCNTVEGLCLHDGDACPFSAYRASPPAAGLGLRYAR